MTRLSDLSDVNISSPTDGQVLKYDQATGRWVNGEAASAYTGPLDLVPGAVVAYSVRALSAAWLGGNLFRLRRDSDDAEVTYTADAVTGEAPVATINTWIGAAFNKTGAVVDTTDTIVVTNATGIKTYQPVSGANIPAGTIVLDVTGTTVTISQPATGTDPAQTVTFTPQAYVVTWFDQSGNSKDATKATASLQTPFALNQINGKCAPVGNDFIGGSLQSASITIPNGEITWFNVGMSAAQPLIYKIGNLRLSASTDVLATPSIFMDDGAGHQCGMYADNTGLSSDTPYLWQMTSEFGASSIKVNGVALAETENLDAGGALVSFADTTSLDFAGTGAVSCELIVYPIIESAPNLLSVAQNSATYYGITLP